MVTVLQHIKQRCLASQKRGLVTSLMWEVCFPYLETRKAVFLTCSLILFPPRNSGFNRFAGLTLLFLHFTNSLPLLHTLLLSKFIIIFMVPHLGSFTHEVHLIPFFSSQEVETCWSYSLCQYLY